MARSKIPAAEPQSRDRTLEPYLNDFGLPALAAAVFSEGVVVSSGNWLSRFIKTFQQSRADPVELTDKGSSMRSTSRDASLAWLAQAIAKLNKQEQATLFEAGEIINRLVEL